MADKDVRIRVTLEGREAEVGIRDLARAMKDTQEGGKATSRSFTELNQALELAGKGISLLTGGYSALKTALGNGQDVFEVKNAFAELQSQAGQTADQGIKKLRDATAGLLSDFELMKQSNIAQTFGVTQAQFEELAGAADALGGAVGVGLSDSLSTLTRALGTGQERMLKQLGITIELTEAEKKYRDSLDETGQKLFNQERIIEAVRSKKEKLGDADKTAGDAMEAFTATLENQKNAFVEALATNTDLRDAIQSLTDTINSVDGAKFVQLLSDITSFAATAASALIKLGATAAGAFDDEILTSYKKKLDGLQMASSATGIANQLEKEIDATKSRIELLSLEIQSNPFASQATEDLKKYTLELKSLEQSYKLAVDAEFKLSKATDTTSDSTAKATVNLDKYKKSNEEAAKKVAELKSEYHKLIQDLETDSLKQSLEEGISTMSDADFNDLKDKIINSTTEGFKESLKKYKKAGINTDEAIAKNREQLDRELHEKRMDALEQEAEQQKQMLQDNISFFSDIFDKFTSTSTKDWGDMLKDMFLDVAKGFASGVAGEFASSMGFDAGSFGGSAGGFGQMLSGIVMNYAKSAATDYVVGQATGTGLATAGQTGGATGALGGYFSGASTTALLGGAAAAAYGAYYGYDAYGKITENDGKRSEGALEAYLLGTGVLAPLAPFVGWTGINDGRNIDPGIRRSLRGMLQETGLGEDLSFAGVKGKTSLFTAGPNGGKDNFNVDFSNPLAAGAVSLTQGLGDVFAGGSDKAGDDLAGIFANAVMEADNFNEVLVNTMSLMDQMGTNAQEQKDSLAQLFLEGKVSLEEFSGGIAGLNVIAQENLAGKGSVADAMKIVAENIEKGPGTAMKGLELALKEAAEIGITSMSELGTYLGDKLGPEGKAVFDRLQAAGITSFEDIQNASADQIALIFNELSSIQGVLMDTFAGTAQTAANAFADAADKINKATKEIKSNLSSLNRDLDSTKEKSDDLADKNNGRNNNDPLGRNE